MSPPSDAVRSIATDDRPSRHSGPPARRSSSSGRLWACTGTLVRLPPRGFEAGRTGGWLRMESGAKLPTPQSTTHERPVVATRTKFVAGTAVGRPRNCGASHSGMWREGPKEIRFTLPLLSASGNIIGGSMRFRISVLRGRRSARKLGIN